MHSRVIISLASDKTAPTKQSKGGRPRLGRQHQALSASFISALAARLAKIEAPLTANPLSTAPRGSELQRSQSDMAGKAIPNTPADGSTFVALPSAMAEESPAQRRARSLASRIRTAHRGHLLERSLATTGNGRHSNRNRPSASERAEAQPIPARDRADTSLYPLGASKRAETQSSATQKSSETADRAGGRVVIQSQTKRCHRPRFGAVRLAAYPFGRSLHFNSNTFRKASVGIRRLVLANRGPTQPHFGSLESRKDSYLPATTSSAARRRLPSKASRFWGRSESHHPSFRALGLPQKSDKLTSSPRSSGRLPSPSKSLGAKLELVAKGRMEETAREKPLAEGARAQAKLHKDGAHRRVAKKVSAALTGQKPSNSVRGSRRGLYARPIVGRTQGADASRSASPMRQHRQAANPEASAARDAIPSQNTQNSQAGHSAEDASSPRLPIARRRPTNIVKRSAERIAIRRVASHEPVKVSKLQNLAARYSTLKITEARILGSTLSSLNGRPSAAGQLPHKAAPHSAPRGLGGGKRWSEKAQLGTDKPPAALRTKGAQEQELRQIGHAADGAARLKTAPPAQHTKLGNFKALGSADRTDEPSKVQNALREDAIEARGGGETRQAQASNRETMTPNDVKRSAQAVRRATPSAEAVRLNPSRPRRTADYMRPVDKHQVKQQENQFKQHRELGAPKRSSRSAAKPEVVATERSEHKSSANVPSRTGRTSQPARRSAMTAPKASRGSAPKFEKPGGSSSDGGTAQRGAAQMPDVAGTGASKKARGVREDLRPKTTEANRSAGAKTQSSEVKQASSTVRREPLSRLTREPNYAPKSGEDGVKLSTPSRDGREGVKPPAPTSDVRPGSRPSAVTSRPNEVEGAKRPTVSVEPRTAANADSASRPSITSVSQTRAQSVVSGALEVEPAGMAMRTATQQDRVVEMATQAEGAAPRLDAKESNKGSNVGTSGRDDTKSGKNLPEVKPPQMNDQADRAQRTHRGRSPEPAQASDRGSNEESVDGRNGLARPIEGRGHHHITDPMPTPKASLASELRGSPLATRESGGGRKMASLAEQSQESFANVAFDLRASGLTTNSHSVSASHQGLISHVAGEIKRLFRSGKQEMRIRLRPPELGGMRIRIEVTHHSVKAALVVDQPHAHALLEQNLSQLWRALQEQGLKVDTLSVEVGGGSEEFSLGSQSEGYSDGRGYGASRPNEPWRDVTPDAAVLAGGLVSGLRLLDVMA